MKPLRIHGWLAWLALAVLLQPMLLDRCTAQRSGGGFGGGGFGGGVGSNVRDKETFTSANILSPGEADDWPFIVRDGETLIFSVSTDKFDPMVEVVGADGKVLAKNDDIRRGEQDSLLLVYFPKAGTYKALVKAAKAGAGGEYSFSVTRFVATDARVGARTAGSLGKSGAQWHRFSAEAGQTLVVTARSSSFEPDTEIYAPNGELILLGTRGLVREKTERTVFRANMAGAYYVRVSGKSGSDSRFSYSITVAVARVFQTNIGDRNPERGLDAGGLDLWTFKGSVGDLVRISARAPGGGVSASVEYVPPTLKEDEPRMPEGPAAPLVPLPVSKKAVGEQVALLNRAGNYQISISHTLGQETAYTLTTSAALKPWKEGPEVNSNIALGETDYWAIEGAAGQILRFEGLSEQFDALLEFYSPNGEIVGTNDDGGAGHNALLTALLTEPGRYLLRVHAYGDGGRGTYRLKRTVNPVKPLEIDRRVTGAVGSFGSEIWSFKGRAGQTIILSVRSSDFDTRVGVYGPDALEIARDDDGGDGTDSLLSVRLPLDGTYTVWVSAGTGGGQYALRLMQDP